MNDYHKRASDHEYMSLREWWLAIPAAIAFATMLWMVYVVGAAYF